MNSSEAALFSLRGDLTAFGLAFSGPTVLTIDDGTTRIEVTDPIPLKNTFLMVTDDPSPITVFDARSFQIEGYAFSVEFVTGEGEVVEILARAVRRVDV
jgi:hypothetical protein